MRSLPHALKKPLLALALGLAACSSEQATTKVDSRPGVNLARYKTYNFMDAVARNDSAFKNSGSNIFDLKRAVTRELEARGFQKADQPDLWVNLALVTQQRVQTREANFRTDGAPYYIGQRNYHWPMTFQSALTRKAPPPSTSLMRPAKSLCGRALLPASCRAPPAARPSRLIRACKTYLLSFRCRPARVAYCS
jgi:hypothetical protein